LRRKVKSGFQDTSPLAARSFILSDPGMEEAFYDSPALHRFAAVDLPPHGRRPVRGDPGMGDAGYQGQTEAIHEATLEAQDMTNRRTRFKNDVDEEGKRKNQNKSRVRAKVEHPFRILKRVFKFTKASYRGLKEEP
jgi:IS5 family transposase